MEDQEILTVIQGLVAEENWVRGQLDKGELEPDDAAARLREIGSRLDEMWSALRKARALRSAGVDPSTIDLRSAVAS
ncbi:MAG: DUF2630 family protein [Kineosporiaceae bacterium]|nr:DUF2630 family protein [Kineosporiaceae bacterium]